MCIDTSSRECNSARQAGHPTTDDDYLQICIWRHEVFDVKLGTLSAMWSTATVGGSLSRRNVVYVEWNCESGSPNFNLARSPCGIG